jgi:hypothetical protein
VGLYKVRGGLCKVRGGSLRGSTRCGVGLCDRATMLGGGAGSVLGGGYG